MLPFLNKYPQITFLYIFSWFIPFVSLDANDDEDDDFFSHTSTTKEESPNKATQRLVESISQFIEQNININITGSAHFEHFIDRLSRVLVEGFVNTNTNNNNNNNIIDEPNVNINVIKFFFNQQLKEILFSALYDQLSRIEREDYLSHDWMHILAKIRINQKLLNEFKSISSGKIDPLNDFNWVLGKNSEHYLGEEAWVLFQHIAFRQQQFFIIKQLIQSNEDVLLPDWQGKSIFDLAQDQLNELLEDSRLELPNTLKLILEKMLPHLPRIKQDVLYRSPRRSSTDDSVCKRGLNRIQCVIQHLDLLLYLILKMEAPLEQKDAQGLLDDLEKAQLTLGRAFLLRHSEHREESLQARRNLFYSATTLSSIGVIVLALYLGSWL